MLDGRALLLIELAERLDRRDTSCTVSFFYADHDEHYVHNSSS